jgi:hypothetical protein
LLESYWLISRLLLFFNYECYSRKN